MKNKIIPPGSKSRLTVRQWLKKYSYLSTESLATLSGLSVRKIIEWKLKYDVVSAKDRKLLTAWLKYKKYNSSEASIFVGQYILSYVRRYGIDIFERRPGKRTPKETYKKLADKSWLNDPKILSALLDKYSVCKIAKMFGISRKYVYIFMHRHGIKNPRPSNFDHKCKNKQWLVEHYVNKGYTLYECAEVAGVNYRTIHEWLFKFGIRPRKSKGIPKHLAKHLTSHNGDPHEFSNIRKAVDFMLDHKDVVRRCEFKYDSEIRITYYDGRYERWVFSSEAHFSKNLVHYLSGEEPLFDDRYPEIKSQETIGPFDSNVDNEQFLMTSKYLDNFKFCNVRIFLHRLAMKLGAEGYKKVICSDSQIQKIKNKVKNIDRNSLYKGNNVYCEYMHHYNIIFPLLFHCFEGHVGPELWSPMKLGAIICYLRSKRHDISRIEIMRELRRRRNSHLFPLGFPVSMYFLVKECFGDNVGINNKTDQVWVGASSMLLDGDRTIDVVDKEEDMCDNCIFLGSHDSGVKYNLNLSNLDRNNMDVTVIQS